MILIKNCCLYRNWLLSSIQFHVFDILPNVLNEETMSWRYFKNQSVPQSLLVYSKEIIKLYTVQFSSVQSLNHVLLFATPWIAARQASVHHQLPESTQTYVRQVVMPSSHLILCRPLLLLPPIPPTIRVISNESTLHEVTKVLEFQLQHQSFQWTSRTNLL